MESIRNSWLAVNWLLSAISLVSTVYGHRDLVEHARHSGQAALGGAWLW